MKRPPNLYKSGFSKGSGANLTNSRSGGDASGRCAVAGWLCEVRVIGEWGSGGSGSRSIAAAYSAPPVLDADRMVVGQIDTKPGESTAYPARCLIRSRPSPG